MRWWGLWLCGCSGPLDVPALDTVSPSVDTDVVGDTDGAVTDTDSSSVDSDLVSPDFAALDPWYPPDAWTEPRAPQPGEALVVHYDGALADRDGLVLQYGWNGWSEQPAFATDVVDHDTSWYAQEQMLRGADGVHRAELDAPAGARALHYVVFDPATNDWDSADGRDFHAGFGVPVVGPYLLWTEEVGPDEGLVVSWSSGMPCLGVVEYGPTPDLGRYVVGETFDTVHHLAITDLTPGEPLYYRVRDSGGAVSPTYQTHPVDPTAPRLTFAALSDMQDNGEAQRWSDIAAEVSTHNPAFLLVAGDMASDDGPGLWWIFFDKGRELLASTPIVPAIGNHDTPTVGHHPDRSSFQRWFPLSGGQGASLDVGPVHLLLIDTETAEDLAADAPQHAAVQADLAACGGDRCRWTFAALHVPPYNAGARHTAEQGGLRELTALFDGQVDWVFAGHEHLYQRVVPMQHNATVAPSGRYGRGAEDGVGYLVLPPAGNWPESTIQSWDGELARYRERLAFPIPATGVDEVDSELGFALVSVEGETLELEVFGMGTVVSPAPVHVRDQLSYTR